MWCRWCRLHSECLTGDVLGSLKCDCGPQLDAALERMAEDERQWLGLAALPQAGRARDRPDQQATRLSSCRIRASTRWTRNERLGLPSEARDFPVAARMLDLLGVPAVRLLTNNPAKVAALKAVGVTVVERVAHQLPANPHNARYLDTKRDRTGHLLK